MAQNNFVQKNVGFNSEAVQEASPQAPITSSQWLSRGNRNRTNLDDVYIETRPFRHAHVLRRPRAMQHYNSSSAISSSSSLFRKTESRDSDDAREGRSTDNVQVQLARVDLFIDLVWVGIVANLSGTFGEQSFSNSGVSIGEATLEYILLFLPMWRLWDNLREYGSDFYKDDLLQRLFVIWILLLCVLYGINAPYAFVPDGGNSLRLVISIYLVARASFLAGYVFQAIFLPFLRLQVLISGIGMMIGSALWIAAMYVPYPAKTALLITANTIEHPMAMYMASPYSARLLTGGWEKKLDFKHYIERIEGFFIIILGEGVFRLIEGSPSGMGLNHKTGTVLTALLLYYVLHWVYFNGDQSREFVHALRRRWWRAFLWKFFHVVLFATLLLLAASVLFVVENDFVSTSKMDSALAKLESETESLEETSLFTKRALWSASGSLSIVILTMTAIALLNRPLDKPNTLIVNSRWLRLAPRVPAIAIICCLPLFPHMSSTLWCGAATSILYVIFLWEWMSGMERDWKVLEPKEGVAQNEDPI